MVDVEALIRQIIPDIILTHGPDSRIEKVTDGGNGKNKGAAMAGQFAALSLA